MRGLPFAQSDFSRGLNTIASAYKVDQGEARECLNVVGSVRGAVKKRFGSTVFASSANAPFPTLAVTDSFVRANENPLSNGGKWTLLPGAGLMGFVRENKWTTGLDTFLSGAYWNVAEQTNPAVSVGVTAGPGLSFVRLVILTSTTEFAGYIVEVTSGETWTLYRVTGGVTTTLSST